MASSPPFFSPPFFLPKIQNRGFPSFLTFFMLHDAGKLSIAFPSCEGLLSPLPHPRGKGSRTVFPPMQTTQTRPGTNTSFPLPLHRDFFFFPFPPPTPRCRENRSSLSFPLCPLEAEVRGDVPFFLTTQSRQLVPPPSPPPLFVRKRHPFPLPFPPL